MSDAASISSALEGPTVAPTPARVDLHQTQLAFLMVNGRRRTMAFDEDATIGRVKELLWNTWLAEWQDERPPGPNFLRILYMGKMLQDDETLASLKLPPWSAPTIMHLSVRPTAPPADDGGKKARMSCILRRGTSEAMVSPAAVPAAAANQTDDAGSGSCCCVIC